MTRGQCIEFAQSKGWEMLNVRERAFLCLWEPLCCMPLDVMYESLRKTLGRSVYSHELTTSNIANLQWEFLGKRDPATLDEIIGLIPEEKRLIVQAGEP